MANTYTLIEAKTLTTTTASITFSSIPATYTDLKIVASTRTSQSGINDDISLQFNGSAANFSYRVLQGNGASAASYNGTTARGGPTVGDTATANTFGSFEMYISNYTSANFKSFSIETVTETNGTTAYAELGADLWSNTAAITSVSLIGVNGSFLANSTFYLYGIKNS